MTTALSVHNPTAGVESHRMWLSLATVLALQIAVTLLGPLQQLFDTTSITIANWTICALVASTGLWIEEAQQLIYRTRTKETHQ